MPGQKTFYEQCNHVLEFALLTGRPAFSEYLMISDLRARLNEEKDPSPAEAAVIHGFTNTQGIMCAETDGENGLKKFSEAEFQSWASFMRRLLEINPEIKHI